MARIVFTVKIYTSGRSERIVDHTEVCQIFAFSGLFL